LNSWEKLYKIDPKAYKIDKILT